MSKPDEERREKRFASYWKHLGNESSEMYTRLQISPREDTFKALANLAFTAGWIAALDKEDYDDEDGQE